MVTENIAQKVKQYIFNQRDSTRPMSESRKLSVDSTYCEKQAKLMNSAVTAHEYVRLGTPNLHKDETGLARYTL